MRARLDNTDWRILRELQENGRITNVELAGRVGISAPPCLRRVRALEKDGIIKGYHAHLDARMVGFEVMAFCMVGLVSQVETDIMDFIKLVDSWEIVRECYLVSGESDFMLKCVAKDLGTFQNFIIDHLTKAANVASVKTSLMMRQSKSEPGLPLEDMLGAV